MVTVQVCLKKAGSVQHEANPFRQERRGLLSIRFPALRFGDGKIREMGKLQICVNVGQYT